MEKVKIKFFEQSLTIQEPIITPSVLFFKRLIEDNEKGKIYDFFEAIIERSIEFGREQTKKEIRNLLGIK